MAKDKVKTEETKEVKEPKTPLEIFLNEHKDDHYNFCPEISFRVSSGSIELDLAMDGGFPPGIHRFGGASEGGKTSESLEVIYNFLQTVPNSKALYVKAEGRMSKKMQKRSGIKFVTNAKEWVPGTCFILKMNVYEPVAQFIYDLIKINPDNYRYAFVIDSLDGMMKKADLEKSFTDAVQVCGPNVLTKLLFKKVSLPMSELGHLMIVIVQVIAKIEQKYDIKEQMAISGGGGNAANHFANYILTFQPRYKDGFITSDGAKVTNVEFGETKIIGHWANILLEKTENENSKLKVKYPILYSADGKEGRIATELEIKKMLTMLGFITSKGAWIYFSENAVAKMKEAGISDVQDKINGENKFNIYISQPEILEFWKSTLSNYMSSKDLL